MRVVPLIAILLASTAFADAASSNYQQGLTTTPFSATSATATATSPADKTPGAMSLTLGIVWSAGITGAPATCTIQPQRAPDGANFVNWGPAISVSPAASTTQIFDNVNPGTPGKQIKYVWNCGTFPTAGTFTMTVQYTNVPTVHFLVPSGPNPWSCTVSSVGTSLTQCQAAPAAGLRVYITTIIAQTTTTTASTTTIRYGTGTNCATGTTTLWGAYNTPISSATPLIQNLGTPLVPAAANALCVISGSGTNTQTVTLGGYTTQ